MEEEFNKEDSEEREMNRQYYQRELRSLELIAYAELLSAVRASGALDESKRNIINFVREAFHIPDERHKAEIRRVTADERLGLIADMVNGKSTSQGWVDEGFTHFPALPHLVKYIKDQPPDEIEEGYERVNNMVELVDVDESEIPKDFFSSWIREPRLPPRYFTEKPKGEDFTQFSIKSESESSTSQSSESESSSEDEMPAIRPVRRRGPVKRKIFVSKIKIQPTSVGRGNPSPDITDTPTKREIIRTPAKRGRGAKRKISTGNRTPPTIVSKIINRPGRGKPIKVISRTIERTSSGETPDEDVPIKKTKPSELLVGSTQIRGRGRGLGRIRGGRGIGIGRGGISGRGGRGRGGKREGRSGSPNKSSLVASKLKIKLNRPLKSKIKKVVIPSPVGSRRKSKLKEKPIDDLIVEMRNYDDHVGRSFVQTEMSMKKIHTNEHMVNNLDNIDSENFDSTLKENKKSADEVDDIKILSKSATEDGEDISIEMNKSKFETEPSNNNNEEDILSQNDKDSSSTKSDSENSSSSFTNKTGSRPNSPSIPYQPSVSKEPLSEVVISSSGSNSNQSSSSSTTDDNEENENTSDTDNHEVSKISGNISQMQNQSSNSPIPLQSINSQQCSGPTKELPSPPVIQKPIRHKISAGVNPSPGVIIQQPRNPLPAPVFSTSLNMSNFHKKRTKLLTNNAVDGYNLHLPSSISASGVTTTVATASSLATRRPNIIHSAGVGGIYSNSPALTPSGRTPGILHQARKAHPHILSTSKAHRNFIPNSTSNTNSLSTNNISLNTQTQSVTVSSVSTNCISSVSNSVQVQANQNYGSATAATISAISSLQQTSSTTTATAQNFTPQSGSALSMGNAIPIGPVGVARTQGANIIFLQKASSSNATGNQTLTTNVLPVKNSPRAVILRRAQIPRQGNVMILDVQKNQLVNASQVPQFLQTARILNATPDLSVLNIPGNQPTRKIIQTASTVSPSPPSSNTITYPAASSMGLESPFRPPGFQAQVNVQASPVRKARIIAQQSVVVSSTVSPVLSTTPTTSPTTLRTTISVGSSIPSVITPSVSIPNCLSTPGITQIVARKEQSMKIQPLHDGVASFTGSCKVSNNFQCPIEAELMAMERNDIYEEEVGALPVDVASGSSSSTVSGFPKVYPTSTYQLSNSNKIEYIKSEHLENNRLVTSLHLSTNSGTNISVNTPLRISNNEGGSSTDTASENESSFTTVFPSTDPQNAKLSKTVELSNIHSSNNNPLISTSISVNSKPNSDSVVESSGIVLHPRVPAEHVQTTPMTEDILVTAFKSSGLIFNDSNPFFDNEDEISTNSFLAGMDSSQDPEVGSQVEVITIADVAE